MSEQPNKPKILLSKVPEVTIYFWIIKVLCTTVGETFADFLNFNLGFGLTNTTIIMGVAFFILLFLQFRTTKYVPAIYWLTVVLISVFGTLVTDNLTDGIGVPLEKSTTVFSILLGLTFLVWYLSEKTLSIHSIYTRKREVYYWLTILFTFALGTAVGDLYSEQLGLGYFNTGLTVVIIIAIMYLAWKWLRLDAVLAFWVVYILTRPLGASLGDYLSQTKVNGGLGLGTTITSVIFLVAILAVIIFLAVTQIDTVPNSGTAESEHAKERKRNVLIQTVSVLCVFLAVGIGGYVQLSNKIASQIDSSGSSSTSNSASLAGQLTDFVNIENDMSKAVNVKDFAAAKKGADNLEHKWDTSEPKLRKIDGSTWTQIDGTIDVVLAAVRNGKPDANQCNNALQESLKVLNEANKTAASQAPASSQSETSQSPAASPEAGTATPHAKLAGRLTEFVNIENEMLNAVNTKDFAAAKKGADNLEHQWDNSEPKLRKIDGSAWTKIDGTIDVVLANVRKGKPIASQCVTALNDSLNIMSGANQ
ncbi:COG4705 family protein [Paenibacillus sp. MMO-58]|uniref:COG4705 family protein n=1 Tax=Paenibacillus sp. MMO-58 TaxID=3081290 RepID=UPI00301A7402